MSVNSTQRFLTTPIWSCIAFSKVYTGEFDFAAIHNPKMARNYRLVNLFRLAAGSRGMETSELTRVLKTLWPTFGFKPKSL